MMNLPFLILGMHFCHNVDNLVNISVSICSFCWCFIVFKGLGWKPSYCCHFLHRLICHCVSKFWLVGCRAHHYSVITPDPLSSPHLQPCSMFLDRTKLLSLFFWPLTSPPQPHLGPCRLHFAPLPLLYSVRFYPCFLSVLTNHPILPSNSNSISHFPHYFPHSVTYHFSSPLFPSLFFSLSDYDTGKFAPCHL